MPTFSTFGLLILSGIHAGLFFGAGTVSFHPLKSRLCGRFVYISFARPEGCDLSGYFKAGNRFSGGVK